MAALHTLGGLAGGPLAGRGLDATNSPFQVGETYQGAGRHARHAITVREVRPVAEEHDRVLVVCACGASFAFLHWRLRLGGASSAGEGGHDRAATSGKSGKIPLSLLRLRNSTGGDPP